MTRWTFVGKVMSLLFNTPSRFVIAFLPRNKHLLISWLRSPSVILEPQSGDGPLPNDQAQQLPSGHSCCLGLWVLLGDRGPEEAAGWGLEKVRGEIREHLRRLENT